jgi:hypothetical protein
MEMIDALDLDAAESGRRISAFAQYGSAYDSPEAAYCAPVEDDERTSEHAPRSALGLGRAGPSGLTRSRNCQWEYRPSDRWMRTTVRICDAETPVDGHGPGRGLPGCVGFQGRTATILRFIILSAIPLGTPR